MKKRLFLSTIIAVIMTVIIAVPALAATEQEVIADIFEAINNGYAEIVDNGNNGSSLCIEHDWQTQAQLDEYISFGTGNVPASVQVEYFKSGGHVGLSAPAMLALSQEDNGIMANFTIDATDYRYADSNNRLQINALDIELPLFTGTASQLDAKMANKEDFIHFNPDNQMITIFYLSQSGATTLLKMNTTTQASAYTTYQDQAVTITASGQRVYTAPLGLQNTYDMEYDLVITTAEAYQGQAEQTPDNLYTDSQGNSLLLPYGERSFASKVISFSPGTSAPTGDARWNNPQMALGEPQGGDMNDSTPRLVTLGYDGVLVVGFDVWFNDGPGEDIWVFELGADIEPTKVEVSQDGINWIFVGNSEGATSFVDMDGYVDKDMYFNYIRLTDIDGMSSGAPGADIDAVAVINNATANPNPELVLTPEIEQPPVDGEFNAEAMPFGANFSWQEMDGVLGYRIYRSEVEGEEGISITDFYIEDTNRFVDVNVDGGKTYWYSIRGVIAEADPFNDKTEVLTAASDQIKVVMPANISGGNASGQYQPKQFILMQINNPMMSINGLNLEVDPGQGTSPIIKDSRTLVPIRAIVEGMGGNVGWDEAARQVDLLYADNEVSMWLGSKQLIANNNNLTMDVPPDILNGRTMLPIRFAAENLGCTVEWINSTREIVIIFR